VDEPPTILDSVYRLGTRRGEKAIPVGVVSKNYRLVDHQLLLTIIQQALFANDIDMKQVPVTGSWTVDGERAHFSFLFPDNERFVQLLDGDEDQMRFRIEVFNFVDCSTLSGLSFFPRPRHSTSFHACDFCVVRAQTPPNKPNISNKAVSSFRARVSW
jgi:hypothetical protein